MLGPVNLSFHDEMGLLVDGFDAPAALGVPIHPPHYRTLLEGEGYERLFDQHAYRIDFTRPLEPAIVRAMRLTDRAGTIIRPLRPDAWNREVEVLHALYNAAFEGVWGFVPIEWDDFRLRAAGFRSFVRAELALIAEHAGQPVGFAVALPEISPLLRRIGGRLWPWGALYLALRASGVREARCMLLGVVPDFTGRGVAPALAGRLYAAGAASGLIAGELSLVHEASGAIRRVIEAFGGRSRKTFRLYRKALLP
jgi:GNAT superfamily N-acetyltransferase